jgi:hypothetical protein
MVDILALVAFLQLGGRVELDLRATWRRGLCADSGHPTGSISASERDARVRAPVSRNAGPELRVDHPCSDQ